MKKLATALIGMSIAAATGVQATAGALADLLVEDLPAGSAGLRQRIPGLLQELVDAATLMLVGEEYRLQTRESAEWETDFRRRLGRLLADDGRLAGDFRATRPDRRDDRRSAAHRLEDREPEALVEAREDEAGCAPVQLDELSR